MSSSNNCSGARVADYKLLVIETLGPFTLPFALIFRRLGWSVRYLEAAGLLRSQGPALERLGIRVIDFGECREPHYGVYAYDQRGLARAATYQKFGAAEDLPDSQALFPQVSNLPQKLWLILAQAAEAEIFSAGKLVAWIESVDPRPARVKVMINPGLTQRVILESTRVPVEPLGIPALHVLESALGLASGLIGRLLRRVGRLGNRETIRITGPAEFKPGSVVYFPHQGTAYGKLYQKDHFYSDDHDSQLHPAKILHIELADRLAANQYRDLQRDYSSRGIPFRLWSASSKFSELGEAARRYWRFLMETAELWRRPRLAIYLFAIFVRFHHYRQLVQQLSGCRLALVGYEIVFPKTLALALESVNIKTVAIQERFMHAFTRENFGFILDTYLCATPRAAQEIREHWHRAVRDLRPIGMLRSDLLHKYQQETPRFAPVDKRLVVAFDYLSPLRETDSKTDSLINWEANRAFLHDLVRLAQTFPSLHLVIRGKNDDWCHLPAFQDLLMLIDQTANIEVNRNYNEWDISYRLAAQADLIIAKPTSIADEALAIGKPVLFHDYTHNASRALADLFATADWPGYVHSYSALADAVAHFVNGGDLYDLEAQQRLKQSTGGLNDGQVRHRLQRVLEELLS